MDGSKVKWEDVLIRLQALARGVLIRNEVRRAKEDFENIVKEIDGDLSHLQWRDTVISIPHFTDTHGPLLRLSNSTSRPADPGLCVNDSLQTSSSRADQCLSHDREQDQHLLLERIEAERDESKATNNNSSSHDEGDGEAQRQESTREEQGANEGRMMESTGDSTSVWSSLDLDANCGHSQRVSQQFCLDKESLQAPEALRVHRNTLTMELVWLQQAIDSRKKYLLLKDRLSLSS